MIEKLLEGAFILLLLWAAFTDIRKREIPDAIWIAVLLLAAADMGRGGMALAERLAGLLCVSLPMAAIAVARPGAFGGGDIKLAAAGGAFLGVVKMLAAGGTAILLGGIVLAPLLLAGKITREEAIPFGPFLSAGMAAGLLWGTRIAAWYIGAG